MRRLSLAWPVLAGDAAADALVYVTLGWLAASTGELSASLVLAANTAPAIVLMLLGGAVADRWGVSRVATWTTLARAVLLMLFALTVSVGLVSAPVLFAAALVLGVVDAVHQPAVYGLVALLAESGEQRSSQAMVVGLTRTVGVLGAVAGGALIGRSIELPLPIGAALLVIAAVFAARIPRDLVDEDPEEPTSLWLMARNGVDAVRSDRPVAGALLLFTIGNFVGTAPLSLGIPFMAESYGWAGAGYGLVYAGFGVGQVLGGLAFAALSRSGRLEETHLGLGTAACLLVPGGVGLVALGLTDAVGVAALCIAATGLFLAPAASILMGWVRERTPSHLQGRVNGIIMLSITASVPLGMILFGVLVEAWSVGPAIIASGVLLGAAAVIAALASRLGSAERAAAGGDLLGS